MQNKGFVKVFAVLLTLVCLFYLSFSFVTRYYNNKAAEYAGGDPSKESLYLDSLSTQKVWLGYTLKQCREMEISLGLDLKGGMNVVLELNVADVIRSLSNNNQDENFNKALTSAYARQATSQKDFIDLFAEEYKNLDSGARLSAIFSTFELKDKITPQSTDAQVVAVLKEELKSAIDNSFNVLRTRIDRFGVVSPNIQRLETAGRILVELPGVKEPERVRKLLQGSANLEFWETYQLPEVYQQLVAADNILATVLAEHNEDATVTETESVSTEGADTTATETTAVEEGTNTNEADSLLAQIAQDKPEAQANQSMEEFAKQLFGPETKTKFRPHHFPFTEPSAEVDVSCFKCGGSGEIEGHSCRFCKGSGWIEILGCGMVHPHVFEMCGIDPEEYTGFAFGVGLERIALLKYEIDDMRELYKNDIRFLKQF
jgi:SecD/SecF fusion protein